MDSFDDLLAPSRRALEDNPFADPFAKRSNSPDPWATPFSSSATAADDFIRSTTPTLDSYTSTADSYNSISDTVGGVAHNVHESPRTRGDVDIDPSHIHSPGFRESVSVNASEVVTVTLTEQGETEPLGIPSTGDGVSTISLAVDTQTNPSSSTLSPQSRDVAKRSGTASHILESPSASSSTSRTSNELVSPLENPISIGSTGRSIAGLSLGRDSLGGEWQSQQSPWSGQADDDSDDDKPIGQTMRLPESGDRKPSSVPPLVRSDNGLQPVFVISVEDPQKVGDPIRSFTMYTVHTRTTSPLFQKSAFSVLRRYSDFLWLYETLSTNNPGVVVPPVPEKNPFGRFDDQFVRQRRFALEKCIQKIANHPVLSQDSDLRMFLESDSFALDIKHRKSELAHERGGVLASIGQVVTGPRFHETDEWFDRQKAYLDSLESQLRGLVKTIEIVARQRNEIATATGEFAQAVSELSSSDVGKQLSHSLAGLAEVERKAQELQISQSEQDMVTFMGTVDEYARLINSVRLAFSSRIRTYHSWRAAESEVLRVKQNHERNRAQGRIPTERLGYSLSQIAETEQRAMEAKHEYEHVSKLVKSEVARFEQERIQDFKDSLHAFLEGMISKQKELIGGWENYQQMLLKRIGGGGAQNVT